MAKVTSISQDAHNKKVWITEYLKHIDDEKIALECFEYWLVDATCDGVTITDELLTNEAKNLAISKLESDRIYAICKQEAHRFLDNAAVTRFMHSSTIKTDGFRFAQVASMLCNIVEHTKNDEQKELVLKTIQSKKPDDVNRINGLLTKQLEAATQLIDDWLS